MKSFQFQVFSFKRAMLALLWTFGLAFMASAQVTTIGKGGGSNVLPGSGISTNISGGNTTVAVDSTVARTNGGNQTIFQTPYLVNGFTISAGTGQAVQWDGQDMVVMKTTLGNSNSDGLMIFEVANQLGSGPGVCVPFGGTNPATSGATKIIINGVTSVNADGSTNYIYDPVAMSFVYTPQSGNASDLPGMGIIVENGNEPFGLASAETIGGKPQNYPWYYTDPSHSLFHWPIFDPLFTGTNMPDGMTWDNQKGATHQVFTFAAATRVIYGPSGNLAPSVVYNVSFASINNQFGNTTLYTVPASGTGKFQINTFEQTSVAGGAGTMTTVYNYTDTLNNAQTVTGCPTLTLGTAGTAPVQGVVYIYAKANTTIGITTVITGSITTSTYLLAVDIVNLAQN